MMETLKIDEDQLDKVLNSVRHSSPSNFSVQQFLSIFQIIAIICAGLWALHEYVSFRKEYENLQLKKDRFAIEQQEIRKEQQRLSLEMAKLSLPAKKTSNKLSALDLKHKSEERIVTKEHDLEITEISRFGDGSRLYKAEHILEVENKGDAEFEITYTVIQFFVGSTTKDIPNPGIIHFNVPPDIFNVKTPGNVKWNKLGQYASRYGSSNHDMRGFFSMVGIDDIDSGGGLCAHLRAGESSSFGYSYLVRAKPDDIAAFVVNIGIDGAISGRNVWYFKKWGHLSEAKKTADTSEE